MIVKNFCLIKNLLKMKIKFLGLFVLFLFIFNFSVFADIVDLRNLFSFGVNLYEYDFSISSLSYEDVMKIVKNNKSDAVQSEVIITWLAHQKNRNKYFIDMKNDISHFYLTGEKISNLNFLMFILNVCDYELNEKNNKVKGLNLLRESEALISLNPNNPWYSVYNSIIYFLLSKDKNFAEYQFPFYEKIEFAIYNSGNNSKLHYAVGNFFKNTGLKNPSAHRIAVIEYQKAIDAAPDNKALKTIVLKNLIMFHDVYSVNNSEVPIWLSELIYKYTIDINPQDAYAYNNLAYLYVKKLAKPEEGLEFALKAYSIRNSEAEIIDTLAYCYFLNGEFEKARKYYEKAYSLDPKNLNILEHISDFYIFVKQPKLGIKYLEEYLNIRDNNTDILNNLAYLYSMENIKLDRAEELVSLAIEKDDKKKDIYFDTLGWILYKKKRYTDSAKVFDNVKENDIEILVHKGIVYAKVGDYKKSLDNFKLAMNIEPENKIITKNFVVLFNLIEYNDKIRFMKDFEWIE
ncbi:MAG: tetratricopeptide repeat protein [Candidatus Muirbacterium halophilum]|nr:tetratricopeptide repeat protein [Candidatus Muirbacterium halophilum]